MSREADEQEKRAIIEAMAAVTKIAKQRRVCLVCTILNMAELITDAVDSHHVEHGVQGIDWELPASMREH